MPLDRFDAEDLRIMIGQRLSLAVLVPMAVDQLEVDPLAGGDMVEGTLLANVLLAPPEPWLDYGQMRRLTAITRRVAVTDLDGDVENRLPELVAAFRSS